MTGTALLAFGAGGGEAAPWAAGTVWSGHKGMDGLARCLATRFGSLHSHQLSSRGREILSDMKTY